MRDSFFKYAVLLSSILFIIFNYTCKKSITESTPEGTKVVAATGAVLTSDDGLLTLTIPPNALDDDTYINIVVVPESDYIDDLDSMYIVGEVYDFQPDALELNIPAIVEIEMPEDEVSSVVEDGEYPFVSGFSLTTDGVYSLIDSSTVIYNLSDSTAKYSGQIEHFSKYSKTHRIFDYLTGNINTIPRNLGTIIIDVNLGPSESVLDVPHQVTAECQNLTNVAVHFTFINHPDDTPVHWERSVGYAYHVGGVGGESYTHSSQWTCKDVDGDMIFMVCIAEFINPGTSSIDGNTLWRKSEMMFEHEIKCVAADDYDGDDYDGDNILDGDDNCWSISNEDQADGDRDGWGDVCDNCPDIANEDQEDADGDGYGDVCDICEGHDDQEDGDGDGVPNGCDSCPNDFNLDEDLDADGVDDICDNCLYDVNPGQEDKDSDGVGDVCDNCPDDSNADQADTNFDGTGDACEEATNCGDDNLINLMEPWNIYFGYEPCSAVQPRIPYDYIPNTKTSGAPFYTANDQTTTYGWGYYSQVIDQSQWGTDLPFERYGSDFNFLEWYGDHWDVPKLLSTQSPQTEENWVIFFNVMEQDIPSADPTNHYQYGFVFDRDGDPTNNYQPAPEYANDFFKDTDFWVVAYYDPTNGWMLMVVDVNVGNITDISAAKMLISGNTIIVFIPRSEFPAQNIGYRVTAFRHDGSWANDANAGADTQPSVDDGLKRVDIGPE